MTNNREKLGSSAEEIDLFDVLLFECWDRHPESYKRRHPWEQFRAEGRVSWQYWRARDKEARE